MPPPIDDEHLAEVRRIAGHRPLDDAAVCTSVEITGACAPLVGQPPKPALVIRLTHADGTVLPAAVLVLDEVQLHELVRVVHGEVHRAVAKARAIRALS